MALSHASDLSRALARHTEAVCRYYLPAGRRHGRYWIVGDVHNAPGQSLFVRLSGAAGGQGTAGKWQDAATGQHGDLLDLIGLRCGLARFHDAAVEGRRFLGLPDTEAKPERTPMAPLGPRNDPAHAIAAARRLFAAGQPVAQSPAARYLHGRGIALPPDQRWLRFHPRCFCRPEPEAAAETWPAMLAAVTDLSGTVVGLQRTYLGRDSRGKAPLAVPRRALGRLRGHAVRFGAVSDVMLVGEGIETVLSVSTVLPSLPVAAALSAANLAATLLPASLRRLYIAEDADDAGRRAAATIAGRAHEAGIEAIVLRPRLGDFNDDLGAFGPDALRSTIRVQLAPEDVMRFMPGGGSHSGKSGAGA